MVEAGAEFKSFPRKRAHNVLQFRSLQGLLRMLNRTLLTASHCSTRWAGVDHDHYGQPTFTDFRLSHPFAIGIERYDPAWHSFNFTIHPRNPPGGNWGNTCNVNDVRCRRSDALLLDAWVYQGGYRFGHLIRPERRFSDASGYDGVSWRRVNSSNPTIPIAGESDDILRFMLIDKIGAGSGWRTGRVEETCVDIAVNPQQWPNPSRIVLRCQHLATWADSRGGDSGGPVFQYTGGGQAIILGIHHGWNTAAQRYAFAAMSRIRNDLGLAWNDYFNFRVR
jgi:hypothetical protein